MNKVLYLFVFILLLGCSKDNSTQTDSPTEIACNTEPLLATNEATDITETSTVISGNITPPTCSASITSQGFVYGTSNLPTISNSKIVLSGTSISTSLTNLEQNTTYYFRVFLENSTGVYYGNEISFSTSVGDVAFSTSNYSNVTPISVDISFGIADAGGGTISEQGIVYSSNTNPTVDDNKIEANNSTVTINGLQSDTFYYIRPYGINESGLFYGEEISLQTSDGIVEFDVSFSKIKMDGFEYAFEITDDGGFGDLITDKGLYFSDSNNSSNINITESSNGLVTELNANTVYYSFPYYVVNGETEYIYESIEVKTAPENISSELKRVELTFKNPECTSFGGGACIKLYTYVGVDVDVFIDTDMKYIKEARLEIVYPFEPNPEIWATWEQGWIIKDDTYEPSVNKIEISSGGTLIKEVGKGEDVTRYNFAFSVYDYKLRVQIEDYSGNLHNSFFQLNVPDF